MVLPTDKLDADEMVRKIVENAASDVVRHTPRSQAAANDFLLAAQVEVALVKEGHQATVEVKDGAAK